MLASTPSASASQPRPSLLSGISSSSSSSSATSSAAAAGAAGAPPAAGAAATGGRSNMTGGGEAFNIVESYHRFLANDPDLPFPIAAIFALSELVSRSRAATTSELIETIKSASQRLKASLANPVPATAGLDLFTRFVVTKSWDGDDFEAHKQSLSSLAREFATHTVPSCREKICDLVLPFIRDDAVILTHSYSRVVMQVLRKAARVQRKRISVYVTESRPNGLGLRTHEQLTAAGVPCTVILDSAVAYVMDKVDLCLTGAEGVVESGGFLNAIGTYGMAMIAKSHNKPFFALAESFKFLRLFPLSQYDLPASGNILAFPELSDDQQAKAAERCLPVRATKEDDDDETAQRSKLMSKEMVQLNPAIDYTLPDLVTFLFSDVGVLTPSGVGDALLAVYGGAD